MAFRNGINQLMAILDSGASDHMFGNKESFSTYQLISNETIQLASKATMKAVGLGSVVLKSSELNRVITLHDVLHVPDMHEKNLISVNQLARKGCTVSFDKIKQQSLLTTS